MIGTGPDRFGGLAFVIRCSMKKIILLICAIIPTLLIGADKNPGFETQDLDGNTVNYSGTVGTSSINLPTTAGNIISEVFFRCPHQTPTTIRCSISYDGTTYLTLNPGEAVGWSVKGNKTQVKVKANQSNVSYEAVINYESY